MPACFDGAQRTYPFNDIPRNALSKMKDEMTRKFESKKYFRSPDAAASWALARMEARIVLSDLLGCPPRPGTGQMNHGNREKH